MPAVTVVGANSDVLTVSLDGTTNLLLAQQFAALVNGAAAGGTLSASILSGAAPAAVPQGFLGEAVVMSPLPSLAYPIGYAALLDVATGATTISSALVSAPVSILSANGGTTVLAGPSRTVFIAGGGASTYTGYVAPNDATTSPGTGSANLNMVATGAGDDTITTGTGNYDIDPGLGRNVVTLGSGTSYVNSIGQDLITGGASVAGSTAVSTIFLAGNHATVVGGSAPLEILDRTATGPAGGGLDRVTLGSGGGSITGVSYSDLFLAGTASVTAGIADAINVGGATATVRDDTAPGGGATLVFGPTVGGSLLFVAGTAASTVEGGTVAVTVAASLGGSVTFSGATSGNTFMVGTGPGAAATLLDASGATGDNTFALGGAASTVAGGSGADLFMLGTAASSLTGGAGGVNTYEFVASATGGATDVIGDFKPADMLSISGYATVGSALLSSAIVSGGSTTLTLSDQTTIVLKNFTALTGNNLS